MAAVSSEVYLTDLSDAEWALLDPLLPRAKPGGRPRSVNLRMIVNGIFYVLRSGCQWRLLPRSYGPWSTVYAYCRRWRRDGTWERVHATLRERVRRELGRQPTPSAAIIDSQSVKTTERGGPHGYDGAKKLSGVNVTSSLIPSAWSCRRGCMQRMSRTASARATCCSPYRRPCPAWS